MQNLKTPTGQTARSLQELGTYNLTVVHRSGKSHSNADALSRLPCKSCARQQELNEVDARCEEEADDVSSEDTCEEIAQVSRVTTRNNMADAANNDLRPQQLLLDGWTPSDIQQEQLADPDNYKHCHVI